MHHMSPKLSVYRNMFRCPSSRGRFSGEGRCATFPQLRATRPCLSPFSPHPCVATLPRHNIKRPDPDAVSDFATPFIDQYLPSSRIPSTLFILSVLLDYQTCPAQLGRLRTELRDVTRSLKIVKEQLQVEESRAKTEKRVRGVFSKAELARHAVKDMRHARKRGGVSRVYGTGRCCKATVCDCMLVLQQWTKTVRQKVCTSTRSHPRSSGSHVSRLKTTLGVAASQLVCGVCDGALFYFLHVGRISGTMLPNGFFFLST